ncbi:TraX family protein [Enterococcus olivae]
MIETRINKLKFNANTLKIIAVIAMIIDHSAYWWVSSGSTSYLVLSGIGRIVAPIMCYFVAEGYFYTSSKLKYLGRMFLFALVSHFPYVLYFDMDWWSGTSVIWTLFMGLLALTILKSPKILSVEKLILIIFCLMLVKDADWNYIGVLWILGFGFFRGRFSLQMVAFVVIGFVLYLLPSYLQEESFISLRLGMLLSIPLLALYDGTRGKNSTVIKWGFYIAYPLHLLILFILRNLI